LNIATAEIIEENGAEVYQEPQANWPRVSDSLEAITHEHRFKVASFDPFPHSRLLSASRGILHLIGLVISRQDYSKHHALMVLSEPNVSDAIEMALGKPVEGLRNVLNKMPAIMFTKTTYRRLAGLIFDHRAMKVMAHTEENTADLIDTLHYLPEELRLASVIKHILHPREAEIIEIASDPDDAPSGSRSRSRFAARLSDCPSRKSLWNVIQDELFERFITLPDGPVIDDPRVEPLSSIRDLNKAGQCFKNCLSMMIDCVADGEIAIYQFNSELGQKALISVKPKFTNGGLIVEIDEIKGVSNSDIKPELLREIENVLATAGIHKRRPEQETHMGAIVRHIRDLKRFEHPADIERSAGRLSDAIYSVT
jgi:hypothetical protein